MSASLNKQLCHAKHSQLLSVDIQERLAASMPSKVLENVIKNNNMLVQAANELDIPKVVVISRVESIFLGWIGDALHPKFKTISELIK